MFSVFVHIVIFVCLYMNDEEIVKIKTKPSSKEDFSPFSSSVGLNSSVTQ